ncbi:MAG: CpsD/CapB family tyrosine-protein kinase, partial [Blastochloris sp.]|nr:CpsD/CapB family tyrosine-protein kinase [Blastochloris sp.]
VLLDIPAVLYTSDSIALASFSQSVALVTRQGVTPMNAVKSALDEIKHLPVLGVLLNQVRIYTPRLIQHFIPQE